MTRIITLLVVIATSISITPALSQELKFSDLASMKKQTVGPLYTSYHSSGGSDLKIGDKLLVKTKTAGDHYYAVVKGQNSYSLVNNDLNGTELTISKIYPFKDNANGGKYIPLLTTTDQNGIYYTVSFEFASERGEVEVISGNQTVASSSGKIGSVSPNAKAIDCTTIYPFNEGLAIVQKGNSEGVIDAKGEFVIPYNTWKFKTQAMNFQTTAPGFSNGYCVVQAVNGEGYGLIDKQGKIVIPCENQLAFPFDEAGLSLVVNQGKYYFVDKNRKKNEVAAAFLRRSDDLNIASLFDGISQNVELKYGKVDAKFTSNGVSIGRSEKGYTAFDVNGVPKSNNYFVDARHFSDGLAAVGRPDEFGEMKWGYIDERGEIVIPLKFSNEPFDFSEGLAMVIPKDQTEFHYAYIDKTGNVVFTLKEDLNQLVTGSSSHALSTKPKLFAGSNRTGVFEGNYAFVPYAVDYRRPGMLIDRQGKNQMRLLNSLMGESVIQSRNRGSSADYFDCVLIDGQLLLREGGLIDVKRNTVIPPGTFKTISLFDPVSNLSKAMIEGVEGYINRDGQFVIVIGKPSSKW